MRARAGFSEGMYCGVAEDIMEYAGHQNMAASSRNNQLRPTPRRDTKIRPDTPDVDDTAIKVCRAAAVGAGALLESCDRCELSVVLPGAEGQECPVQTQFGELKEDFRAQLAVLRALRNGQ